VSGVDVLRRRLSRAFHGKEMSLGSYTEACELMQAIDRREVAVAELIGAVRLVVEFIDGAHGEPGEIGCKAEDDLRAALARIGGEA